MTVTLGPRLALVLALVFGADRLRPDADARAAPVAPPPPVSASPVLVELFTSQGCSSCPAADAFVRDLPRLGLGRDQVLALTFHVDYWDDLGWKDPFASQQFTERQRRYVRSGVLLGPGGERGGISGAYTPQMIVSGAVHFSGGRRDVALAEIARARAAPAPATLTADAMTEGNRVLVTAHLASAKGAGRSGALPGVGDWNLLVALAMKSARTTVTHGENGGETLEEAAVARMLSEPTPIVIGANAPVRVWLTKPGSLDWSNVELVAFVQSATSLRVIAARGVAIPFAH